MHCAEYSVSQGIIPVCIKIFNLTTRCNVSRCELYKSADCMGTIIQYRSAHGVGLCVIEDSSLQGTMATCYYKTKQH